MPTKLEHRDDDVQPGKIKPTTRDDTTAPGDFQFLTFNGKILTFHVKKLMKQVSA